jgi:hypothetical protein
MIEFMSLGTIACDLRFAAGMLLAGIVNGRQCPEAIMS